jgi:hypothetical protein
MSQIVLGGWVNGGLSEYVAMSERPPLLAVGRARSLDFSGICKEKQT